MTDFTQGDVVRLPEQWNSELGLVYELYADFDDETKYGVSIITESGRDLGGFSHKEQQQYLNLVARTFYEYPFKNVIQLEADYRNGKFKSVFDAVKKAQDAAASSTDLGKFSIGGSE